MKDKINCIEIHAGTRENNSHFYPHVSIRRGERWTDDPDNPYEADSKTFWHVTPASLVRAFLGAMKLTERKQAKP